MPKRTLKSDLFAEIRNWEHNGVTYTRGDPIEISDETGKFTFWSVWDNGDVHVWWVNRCYRSFRPDRVIHRDVMDEPLCSKHPLYKAMRRPRSGCVRCEAAFEQKQKEK